MKCDICGKNGAKVRRLTQTVGRGSSSFLVRNVPVVSCLSCGESYLTAETLKELERMRLHWRELTKQEKVPVATFVDTA
ncbi:MAG: YgiT-type zinc finger domain-containing protein [Candidatus Methylomirabilota bacterium]|nr:type II toxin-antitoxin system MqsA family antitoxin [Candidatus Methylomirabilis sp.]NJD68615.1 type II toxin-antitoxin system MqsA family antitoxin [candidate division NC10 bacterium]PWB46420.1 MAG: YgiT-type zinc finger domain-containing protein [candidate division NC10 bacterium]